MHADISRWTFAPEKHFSAVVSQQGRVELDADLNEHAAIMGHQLRTLTRDLFGPAGGPFESGFDIGFTAATKDLVISAGHYYVDGALVENDRPDLDYYAQPDAFLDADDDELPDPPFLAYLEVWSQLVTPLQDDSIREVALGVHGPDAALRLRTAWKVTAVNQIGGGNPFDAAVTWPEVKKEWDLWADRATDPARSTMRARIQPAFTPADPCVLAPEARYRGLENQLYRVQVHRPGPAAVSGVAGAPPATFVWSRENGSVTLGIVGISGQDVVLEHLGRDGNLGLAINDLVEVVDDASMAGRLAEPLRSVVAIDRLSNTVTLSAPPGGSTGRDPSRHPFLRRWDHHVAGVKTDGDGALDIVAAPAAGDPLWLPLEDGVEVSFGPAGRYLTGDYWLVPARVVTGDVEWPQDSGGPAEQGPQGIRVSYAPLAFVPTGGSRVDARRLAPQLP